MDPQISAYISEQRAAGFGDDAISTALRTAGWDDAIIDQAMAVTESSVAEKNLSQEPSITIQEPEVTPAQAIHYPDIEEQVTLKPSIQTPKINNTIQTPEQTNSANVSTVTSTTSESPTNVKAGITEKTVAGQTPSLESALDAQINAADNNTETFTHIQPEQPKSSHNNPITSPVNNPVAPLTVSANNHSQNIPLVEKTAQQTPTLASVAEPTVTTRPMGQVNLGSIVDTLSEEPEPNIKIRSGGKKIIIVFVVILVLGIIGSLIFFLTRNSGPITTSGGQSDFVNDVPPPINFDAVSNADQASEDAFPTTTEDSGSQREAINFSQLSYYETLIEFYNATTQAEKTAAATALQAKLDALIVNDDEWKLALSALSKTEDPIFYTYLQVGTQNSANDPRALRSYMAALGQLGDNRATTVIKQYRDTTFAEDLYGAGPRVPLVADTALLMLGDESVVASLIEFSKSDDGLFKKSAFEALGYTQSPDATARLQDAIVKDESWKDYAMLALETQKFQALPAPARPNEFIVLHDRLFDDYSVVTDWLLERLLELPLSTFNQQALIDIAENWFTFRELESRVSDPVARRFGQELFFGRFLSSPNVRPWAIEKFDELSKLPADEPIKLTQEQVDDFMNKSIKE